MWGLPFNNLFSWRQQLYHQIGSGAKREYSSNESSVLPLALQARTLPIYPLMPDMTGGNAVEGVAQSLVEDICVGTSEDEPTSLDEDQEDPT